MLNTCGGRSPDRSKWCCREVLGLRAGKVRSRPILPVLSYCARRFESDHRKKQQKQKREKQPVESDSDSSSDSLCELSGWHAVRPDGNGQNCDGQTCQCWSAAATTMNMTTTTLLLHYHYGIGVCVESERLILLWLYYCGYFFYSPATIPAIIHAVIPISPTTKTQGSASDSERKILL